MGNAKIRIFLRGGSAKWGDLAWRRLGSIPPRDYNRFKKIEKKVHTSQNEVKMTKNEQKIREIVKKIGV